MSKAMRFLALVLCVLLAGVWAPAQAEVTAVGILLNGQIAEEDGSIRTVTPEGSFRVWQNGNEIGVIAAGRETLTVNSADRIRIEPVPQTFTPEWDLSTAYLTTEISGGGVQWISVTVTRQGDRQEQPASVPAVTPEPEAAPQETPAEGTEPDMPPEASAEPEITEEPEIEIEVLPQQGPAETPTLPPYTGGPSVTPEPVPAGIPEGTGTGSLRVLVFFDKNVNGNQGNYEYGIENITIYLLDEAENILTSAVTDADGYALFTGLPDGRYKTRTNLPAEWYFTQFGGENSLILNAYDVLPAGSQTSGTVQVASGAEAQQGIGVHNKASAMSGVCWLENEVDGLYTDGEDRLPGVTVYLRHRDEDIVYETVTDGDGAWRIDHLHPGYYYLSCSAPEGLMLTRHTESRGKRSYLTSRNPQRVVEATEKDKTGMDFGFNWSAQICGRCYLDANYNGLYDEGEEPLPGVKLSVKSQYDGVEFSSGVSGEDGTYVLGGMRGDKYYVEVLLPADGSVYTRTAPQEPLGNLFPPRGDRRDSRLALVLADMERREINIGAIYPGAVTGTVYYDDNFSATQDGQEKKVSGFQVTILDAYGNMVAADRTNVNGLYELTGLTPGEYTLEVTAVSGYAFTKRGDGNVILNRTGGEGYSESFRVELGETVSGLDIGMIRPGTVQGSVFADRNDNGVRDADEEGLTGVTVRLMNETEGEEAFRAEIGYDGNFLFDAVMPGRYYLEYDLPERAVFARITAGGNEISEYEVLDTGNTGRTDSFDFVTGQVYDAPCCGALILGRIEGIAYRDHDGNGIIEAEETLPGLTIRLVPSREELDEMIVETGTLGAFILEDLRPDVYQLEVVCPEGMVLSRTDHLKLPLKAGQKEQSVSLNVAMGSEWLNQRIGAVRPAALRGQVWLDENNNGLFDEGERTPAGYTLTVTDEATGRVFDTPVTDEEGRFSAAGMIPGSFTVSLQKDERTLAPKAGDSVFRDENGALTLSGITLQEDETREDLLMGVVRYTTVSGRAWIDRGDLIEDLAGVRVTMTDPDGNVIASAETDSTGLYRLDRLMPGPFRLEVTAPVGCVIIEPEDPRLNGSLRSVVTDSTNRVGTTNETVLQMDQDMDQMDIGCVLPGRLGDVCWLDLNGDGLQAGDEPGIPDVRIELLRDGVPIAETVTDQYGFWRFVDLYPAVYTLRVTAPAEVKPTRHRTDLPMIASVLEETDDSTVSSVPLTVESNRSQYNADLGFVCRKNGVWPAGTGLGETQNWLPNY